MSFESNSPRGASEIEKVLRNQLNILVSTVQEENYQDHINQIQYILRDCGGLVLRGYIGKLIHHLQLLYSEHQTNLPPQLLPLEKLFKLELSEDFEGHLDKITESADQLKPILKYISVLQFVERLDIEPVFAVFLIGCNIDQKLSSSEFTSLESRLLSLIKKFKPEVFEFSIVGLAHFLQQTVLNKSFPLSAKFLIYKFFKHHLPFEFEHSGLEDLLIRSLSTNNTTMSTFKDNLLQLSNHNDLSPKDILPVLLKSNPSEIVSNLACIISEILIPGSQKLPINFFLPGNSLPESTAKGAQLRVIFESIDSKFNISWYIVFTKIQEEYLFESSQRNIQPEILNINQFLSTIDFKNGLLDIFLNYDWYFSKELVLVLHKLDPKDGAYDLNSSNNLTRCFDANIETTIETQLGKRNIISFINIGKLELHVMDQIMSNPSTSNNNRDAKVLELTKIFDHHCHTFPEYLLSACLATADKSPFILKIIDSLFGLLIDHNSKFLNQVILEFKELDNQLALDKLIDYYLGRNKSASLLKIIKLSMDLKFFDELLNKAWSRNFTLGLNVVINASCYGFDVVKVIDTIFNDINQRPKLFQSIVEILEVRSNEDIDKIQQQTQQAQQQQQGLPPTINDDFKILPLQTTHYLLSILGKNNGVIDTETFKNLQLQLLTSYPRLINFGNGHDEAILANAKVSNSFPQDIEQEMKSYYSKLYGKELDSKAIVEMLVRLKSSDVPRDQDILACMIHSLLDEYRFFSEYPIEALASTALLFGALLQRDIIQGTTLTVALNFIWESCNQPPESHLFKFAAQALYNFKSRLHEYPNYCKLLLECKSLTSQPRMYKIIQDASNGVQSVDQPPKSEVNSSGKLMDKKVVDEDSGLKYQSLMFTNHTVGLIQQEKPNETVSDKLLFFINNLTTDNLRTKLPEVKDLLTENFFLWFADYLVGDRAKSEPNNHKLYCELVKEFNDAIFYEYVLNVSLIEVSGLIRNFKDTFNERNHLKNLGAWLGQITLASDRPLKRTQIGLKFLLVEAYDFKTLNIIIPFVCKILDQAQYSKIFRPPNPWVIGVMKVLVELYECGDLKLNSKFEIEVLLNSFNMKISDIPASTLVKSHNPNPVALAALFGIQSTPSANNLTSNFTKMSTIENNYPPNQLPPQQLLQQQQQQSQIPPMHQVHQVNQSGQQIMQQRGPDDNNMVGGPGIPNQQQQPIQAVPPNSNGSQLDTSFSSLIGNTLFTQNPTLRRAFQASLSRAVRECAIPILSRTADSIITTTEALIKKDFAREGDVTRFRKSYQNLALKLTQSMIACNGRKILSETIENTMIQLLSHQINLNDLPLGELNSAIQSNVDLCVDIVNKLASGHIIDLVDDRMKFSVTAREQNQQSGEPFVDTNANPVSASLPLPLGITSEGLTANQLAIYENFAANITRPDVNAPLPPQVQQAGPAGPAGQQLPQPVVPPQPVPQGVINGQPPQQSLQPNMQGLPPQQPQQPPVQAGLPTQDDGMISTDQLFLFISQHCDKLLHSVSEIKETKISELPPDNPISQNIGAILSLAQTNALKHPELLLRVAQYAVNCLFTQNHENPICTEVFVILLDRLCEYSPSTAKDVIWWLVHSTDQRKFNVSVMYSLLDIQLVKPINLDVSLSKVIKETSNPLLIKFAGNLLYRIFSETSMKKIASITEFAMTLDYLSKFDGDDSVAEVKEAKEIRDKLFTVLKSNKTSVIETDGDMYSQLGGIFTHWFKLISHGNNIDDLKQLFIKDLFKNEILTDPELFGLFFKSSIEISIAAYQLEQENKSKTGHETVLMVDSLSLLIVEILLMFDDHEVNASVDYLKNIMGVILVALTNDHESPNNNWNGRAYFRFFSSLLSYWDDKSVLNNNATVHLDVEFYNFIGDVFNSLQPMILPSFIFSWISLISHRMFLPKILELPDKKGDLIVTKLLAALLRFQNIYAKDDDITNDLVISIFKSINRIFVGLYHDYPEFLAENYIQLLASVPFNYNQLRSIILSATPKSIKLENPFTPGLKVERLDSIKSIPVITYQPNDELNKLGLKRPIDNYLRIPAPGLIKSIYNGLKLSSPKPVEGFGFNEIHYNLDLINSLVLYITLSEIDERNANYSFNPKDSHVSIFFDLLNFGSTEFKYHLISGLANQLRFPNIHTNWTLGIFLHFINLKTSWTNNETKSTIQEIIARILIERHLAQKPHQWGLTILFTELIKNGNYNFFQLPFVRNAPSEVKLLLDSLSNNVNSN